MARQSTILRSLKRVWRTISFVTLVGAIPLLVTGCFRGFYVIDHLDIKRQTADAAWQLRIGSGEGNFFLFWTYYAFPPGYNTRDYFGSAPDFHVWHDYGPFDAREGMHLVRWRMGSGRVPGYFSFDFYLGYPTVIVLIALIVVWRVRRILRMRREALVELGRCTKCGYDLRASPDRCPECGRPVDKR